MPWHYYIFTLIIIIQTYNQQNSLYILIDMGSNYQQLIFLGKVNHHNPEILKDSNQARNKNMHTIDSNSPINNRIKFMYHPPDQNPSNNPHPILTHSLIPQNNHFPLVQNAIHIVPQQINPQTQLSKKAMFTYVQTQRNTSIKIKFMNSNTERIISHNFRIESISGKAQKKDGQQNIMLQASDKQESKDGKSSNQLMQRHQSVIVESFLTIQSKQIEDYTFKEKLMMQEPAYANHVDFKKKEMPQYEQQEREEVYQEKDLPLQSINQDTIIFRKQFHHKPKNPSRKDLIESESKKSLTKQTQFYRPVNHSQAKIALNESKTISIQNVQTSAQSTPKEQQTQTIKKCSSKDIESLPLQSNMANNHQIFNNFAQSSYSCDHLPTKSLSPKDIIPSTEQISKNQSLVGSVSKQQQRTKVNIMNLPQIPEYILFFHDNNKDFLQKKDSLQKKQSQRKPARQRIFSREGNVFKQKNKNQPKHSIPIKISEQKMSLSEIPQQIQVRWHGIQNSTNKPSERRIFKTIF